MSSRDNEVAALTDYNRSLVQRLLEQDRQLVTQIRAREAEEAAQREARRPAEMARARVESIAGDVECLGWIRAQAWDASKHRGERKAGVWPPDLPMAVALNRYVGLTDDGDTVASWPETDGYVDQMKQPGTPAGPSLGSPGIALSQHGDGEETSLHRLARQRGIPI